MNEIKTEQAELFQVMMCGDAEQAFDRLSEFNELMMKYNSAIREVKTKLEILSDELSLRGRDNPIESIKSRIKKPLSIVEKLQRQGDPLTVASISEHLNDVAGIRVICPFIDDIYSVAEMLARQDDIEVIRIKDYIRHPKPNGYRSYHMIVEVPVFFSNYKQPMRVEVQIRTVAMDFWASLEHRMKYKNDAQSACAAEIYAGLKECAERIAHTDLQMQQLKQQIDDHT